MRRACNVGQYNLHGDKDGALHFDVVPEIGRPVRQPHLRCIAQASIGRVGILLHRVERRKVQKRHVHQAV